MLEDVDWVLLRLFRGGLNLGTMITPTMQATTMKDTAPATLREATEAEEDGDSISLIAAFESSRFSGGGGG